MAAALLIVLVLAGCFAPSESQTDDSGGAISTSGGAAATSPKDKITDISIAERVLYDEKDIRITAKGYDKSSFFGPSVKVLIENNGEVDVTVQTRDSSVNGIMADMIFSCEVAAGKKANDTITLMDSDLEAGGIEAIKEIELKFYFYSGDSLFDSYTSDPIRIETEGAESYTQQYDDSGEKVLERDGIKIVIKEVDSEDSFWGADINVYIENNSGEDVTIQLRDTSVNGFMISPIFSCSVVDGKKAFDSITFLESDLTENDITSIDSLEFSFHVFESDGWKTVFDSEKVTVIFS